MQRPDWIVLALGFSQGRALTPVQLQKALFLLGQELPGEIGSEYYRFIPYNYGPFDRLIYIDASQLATQGLVAVTPVSGQRFNEYSLTESGRSRACELKESASAPALEYLSRVVAWVQSVSFADLLRSVYARYPAYRANSVFQD